MHSGMSLYLLANVGLDRFDCVFDHHSALEHTPFIKIIISSVDPMATWSICW